MATCSACGKGSCRVNSIIYHADETSDVVCDACHHRGSLWAAKQALAQERREAVHRVCEAGNITLSTSDIDTIVERSGGGYEINDGELRTVPHKHQPIKVNHGRDCHCDVCTYQVRVASAIDKGLADEPDDADEPEVSEEPVSTMKNKSMPIQQPTGNPFIDKALGQGRCLPLGE